MTDAHIHSRELKVYFGDKGLEFEVACRDSSPAHSFPQLRIPRNFSNSSANVTCLLTATAVRTHFPP